MYNRYIPGRNGYNRVQEEDDFPRTPPSPPPFHEQETAETNSAPSVEKGDGKGKKSSNLLSSLLKALKLEDLDTGDILLLLILLFLMAEGDDIELLLTLGLLLLMGLD